MKRPLAPPSIPLPPAAVPVRREAASLGPLKPGLLSRAWQWIRARQLRRVDAGRLQVAETVSLGEKRFVAVVQVDGRHFLLAGGPANIALLAQLDEREPFANVLQKTMTVAEKPASPNTPRKAAAVHAAPPLKARQASRKETANPFAKRPPLTAAPVTSESTFAQLLSTATKAARKPPAKKVPRRNPPALTPMHPTVGPRLDGKTMAAQKKAAAGPEAESFDQWLPQAALPQSSAKTSISQATRRSASKPAIPNGNKRSREWGDKAGASLNSLSEPLSNTLSEPLCSAVPPPPRSHTITIEEHA